MVSTEDFRNYADKGKKIIDDLWKRVGELKSGIEKMQIIINLQNEIIENKEEQIKSLQSSIELLKSNLYAGKNN